MLGLDLATHCGWAVVKGKHLLGYGRWSLTKRSKDIGVGARYLRFLSFLDLCYVKYGVNVVGFENVMPFIHKNVASSRLYGGWVACVHIFAENRKLAVDSVAVTTLKKLATGSGKASKHDMVEAAVERWKVPIQYDDEADAAWVAEYCRKKLCL